jgi:hypothetical protein
MLRALPTDVGVGGVDDGGGEWRGRLSRFSLEERLVVRQCQLDLSRTLWSSFGSSP